MRQFVRWLRWKFGDYWACNYCNFYGTGSEVTNHLLREHRSSQERR